MWKKIIKWYFEYFVCTVKCVQYMGKLIHSLVGEKKVISLSGQVVTSTSQWLMSRDLSQWYPWLEKKGWIMRWTSTFDGTQLSHLYFCGFSPWASLFFYVLSSLAGRYFGSFDFTSSMLQDEKERGEKSEEWTLR